MILDLDIGNTRCKWRVLDSSGVEAACGSALSVAEALVDEMVASLPVKRVRVSNVAGVNAASNISSLVTSKWGLTPEFAESTRSWRELVNGYEKPSALGVDRWLAMCAAWHIVGGSCVVADAGSAITVDIIAGTGLHIGGYIVPGLHLMEDALLRDTSGVRFRRGFEGVESGPGKTTEQAVKQGLLRMAASFIDSVHAMQRAPAGPILLTGGDAELLQPWLGCSPVVRRSLVLEGLALVLP